MCVFVYLCMCMYVCVYIINRAIHNNQTIYIYISICIISRNCIYILSVIKVRIMRTSVRSRTFIKYAGYAILESSTLLCNDGMRFKNSDL